jgi:hypothetical protein
MTTADLHRMLMMELDKQPSGAIQSFLRTELDYALNQAYISLINQKYTGHNILQARFEMDPKIGDDLRPLIEITRSNINYGARGNTLTTNISASDVLYVITVKLYSLRGNVITGSYLLKNIPHAAIKPFLQNEENYPWIPNPVYTIDKNELTIYVSPEFRTGNTTYESEVSYLKKPRTIDYNHNPGDEIEVAWGYEIVQLAATLLLENIESPRVSMHNQLVTQTNQ